MPKNLTLLSLCRIVYPITILVIMMFEVPSSLVQDKKIGIIRFLIV